VTGNALFIGQPFILDDQLAGAHRLLRELVYLYDWASEYIGVTLGAG